MNYEIIVVGGGHAGCEASLASARKGHKTLLVTSNIKNIADMPCNPSIGGSAKGIVVREIDALGGEMGRNADKSLLQIKMLNNAKGPAVRALRAQADKITYPQNMFKTLQNTENLTILEGMVEDLIVKDNKVSGIILENGEGITSNIVILTTGTYLKADIMIGSTRTRSGPHYEKPSNFLSDNLKWPKYSPENSPITRIGSKSNRHRLPAGHTCQLSQSASRWASQLIGSAVGGTAIQLQ